MVVVAVTINSLCMNIITTIKDFFTSLTIRERAKTQQRKKFVQDNKHDLGEQYAGELWDKINAVTNSQPETRNPL